MPRLAVGLLALPRESREPREPRCQVREVLYMLVVLVVYLPGTGNTMHIQARITLTVACIRTCLYVWLDVDIQRRVRINTNACFFSM